MIGHAGRRRSLAGLAISAGVAAAALGIPAQSAAAPTAQAGAKTAEVSVVHGIPGAKVKVCVDGAPAIRKFTYGEKVVRRALPAGNHNVRIVSTGRSCDAAAILRGDYTLKAGKSYTLVASQKPSGKATLRAFANRVRPTQDGQARLTVRHLAQAPAVNVWAGSTPLIKGFTWGDRGSLQVPQGDYRVKVTLPGSKAPVIGPRHLTLREGNAYQVHAVGKAGQYRLVVVRTPVGTH